MDYEIIRRQVKDGDLIFLKVDKGNLLSRTTAWFTRSPYTHTAFVFWYKTRLMLVESTTHGGIRIVLASVYRHRDLDMLPAPVPWQEIEESALSRSGTAEYGWLSAAYIGIREFLFTHFEVVLPVDRRNRNLSSPSRSSTASSSSANNQANDLTSWPRAAQIGCSSKSLPTKAASSRTRSAALRSGPCRSRSSGTLRNHGARP